MPVSNAAADQSNPIVLQSFPDSGYFVIWQGSRNYATSKTDIYTQKYDKNGIRQWVQNGVPVTTALEDQSYAFSSNQDYRNRPFAATDNAGGFYLCYADIAADTETTITFSTFDSILNLKNFFYEIKIIIFCYANGLFVQCLFLAKSV